MADEGALGNAGYAVTGSGGGGEGGRYMFADLAELDAIIKQWTDLRDAIQLDGDGMHQAQFLQLAPAEDEMSQQQATAVAESLGKATDHNILMARYADSFVRKLMAARDRYVADDDSAAALVSGVDEA